MTHPDNDAKVRWLAQETPETVLDPELPIIDPHHHLWKVPSPWGTYDLEDLWADTGSGHNVEQTVFIDARSGYRQDGPEHLKPIGESEFIATVAEQSAKATGKATIGAIISHAHMKLGAAVEEVLVGHLEAGKGLFRGIRSAFPQDLDARFLESFDVLARLDLTFDNFSFDYTRLPDLAKLASAYPGGAHHRQPPRREDRSLCQRRRVCELAAVHRRDRSLPQRGHEGRRCPASRRILGTAVSHAPARSEPIGSEELCELLYRYYNPCDRGFRTRSMHVREQLPGRQGVRLLSNALECVQAHRPQGGSERVGEDVDLQWHGGTRVSRSRLTAVVAWRKRNTSRRPN